MARTFVVAKDREAKIVADYVMINASGVALFLNEDGHMIHAFKEWSVLFEVGADDQPVGLISVADSASGEVLYSKTEVPA